MGSVYSVRVSLFSCMCIADGTDQRLADRAKSELGCCTCDQKIRELNSLIFITIAGLEMLHGQWAIDLISDAAVSESQPAASSEGSVIQQASPLSAAS